ncbi:hypothetical protein EEP13_RS08455 [Escherichia coli]|nr:hypothetical protein [Escherichia coli]
MAVNSNGSNNRVAGRDFHEKNIQIERYDGSHTVNIAIPSNNDDDDRPLLKAQRKELNSMPAPIVVPATIKTLPRVLFFTLSSVLTIFMSDICGAG